MRIPLKEIILQHPHVTLLKVGSHIRTDMGQFFNVLAKFEIDSSDLNSLISRNGLQIIFKVISLKCVQYTIKNYLKNKSDEDIQYYVQDITWKTSFILPKKEPVQPEEFHDSSQNSDALLCSIFELMA